MVSPFSAFRFHRFVLSRRTSRVRDTCPDKACSFSFLAELPRFDNSQHIKMTVTFLGMKPGKRSHSSKEADI
jgi:hypothetical protein